LPGLPHTGDLVEHAGLYLRKLVYARCAARPNIRENRQGTYTIVRCLRKDQSGRIFIPYWKDPDNLGKKVEIHEIKDFPGK
jgi:hypothetical protein